MNLTLFMGFNCLRYNLFAVMCRLKAGVWMLTRQNVSAGKTNNKTFYGIREQEVVYYWTFDGYYQNIPDKILNSTVLDNPLPVV